MRSPPRPCLISREIGAARPPSKLTANCFRKGRAISQQFVHLHTHSEYSLLDGLSRLRDLVARAKVLGMPALAITDHGALYGAVDFYTTAKAAGIKPIVGVETYIARGSRADRDSKVEGHGKPFHLILLAKNFAGYQNLVSLVTSAHLDGYYYRPRMDKQLLREHSDGLIALSACLQGEVSRAIQEQGIDAACAVALEHAAIFGPGNYYLELMSHGIPEQEAVSAGIREVSRRTGVPLVVTNDIHYVHAEDAEAQDIMVCIQSGKTVDQPDRLKMIDHPELYMKSAEQMAELFPDDAEALQNTLRIAEACDLELPLGKLILPHFEVPAGLTQDQQLRNLAEQGVVEKYGAMTPALKERIEHELSVIAKMGYSGYMLIVQDFVAFAQARGILTAVRGSAGGSLVSYVIGLTDIDPLKYGLIFDRFLNLERYTQPDIDVDFMDDRRDEVIAYVTEKYGSDHVAQIVTFNTMLARAAVRDVARVAKVIPTGPAAPTLAESRVAVPELEQLTQEPDVSRLIDLAEKVEGLVRSTGTHAAGVVITRDPLTTLVPIERPKGKAEGYQTQFEDKQIEKLGLLKFDFLGLSNLTILDHALRLIKEQRGISIRREDIPLSDAKTFALLASGETTGLFQLESAGMRRYIQALKPDRVEDVMAMVALFRPGPMEYIPRYIARKHGQEAVTYAHPSLEPVLRSTYGVMVYQEDVMAVTQALAGFTLGEADVLCYAIRKKIREKLDAQKEKFVAGALKNGVSPGIIETVWKDFEPFAQYGFNRAHAAIYGIIAYHTAYLKANYTAEYMTAVLSSDMGNSERVAIAIAECRRMGIPVMAPDVNVSRFDFVVSGEEIRFGLGAIKNVGEGAIENIVAAREAGGPFRSLEDLCGRIDLQRNNKRVLESLIKAGACDAFGPRLAQLTRLDAALATGQREAGAGEDVGVGLQGSLERAGFAVRPCRRARDRGAHDRPRGLAQGAPRLGEGAAGDLRLRPPADRHRAADRRRTEDRVPRGAEGSEGRHRHRRLRRHERAEAHHDEEPLAHAVRSGRGPHRLVRGDGLPTDVRADRDRLERGRDPAPPGPGGAAGGIAEAPLRARRAVHRSRHRRDRSGRRRTACIAREEAPVRRSLIRPPTPERERRRRLRRERQWPRWRRPRHPIP